MQALLFGTEGLELFTSSSSRLALKEYLKKAILYAEVIKCPILVCGNPKNRILQERKKDYPIAIEFFQELGAFAEQHQTTLCIEPNPESYGTNFITTLEEAFSFVTQIDSHGIGMILDSSTMLMNHNSANEWIDFTSKIKHVHLSMPFLQPLIKEYSFYKEWVLEFLKTLHEHSSASFLSLEMVHNKEEEVESSMKLLLFIKSSSSAVGSEPLTLFNMYTRQFKS